MIVLMAYPDDSCARVSIAEARQIAAARGPHHGLRVYDYACVWDGTKDRDPYLRAVAETNRRHAVPPTVIGTTPKRVRTIQSVADLPAEQQRQIAEDGLRLGPEVAGRRWNLSRQSVSRVMKRQGYVMPSNGRWKSSMRPEKLQALLQKAQTA